VDERLVLGAGGADDELRIVNALTTGGGSAGNGSDSFEVEVIDNARSNRDIVHLAGRVDDGVLEKFGDGALHISNVGADLSQFIVREGAIEVDDVADLNGKRVMFYGGVLQTHGSLDPDAYTGWTFQGDAAGVSGGFAARNGKLTVDYGRDLQYRRAESGDSAGGSTLWGPLRLSSRTADSEVELVNSIDMNGRTMAIYVDDNLASEGDFGHISGDLGNGGVIKRGDGALRLSGRIGTGSLAIEQGLLELATDATTSGTGQIVVDGGHFKNNASQALSDNVSFNSGTLRALANSAT